MHFHPVAPSSPFISCSPRDAPVLLVDDAKIRKRTRSSLILGNEERIGDVGVVVSTLPLGRRRVAVTLATLARFLLHRRDTARRLDDRRGFSVYFPLAANE